MEINVTDEKLLIVRMTVGNIGLLSAENHRGPRVFTKPSASRKGDLYISAILYFGRYAFRRLLVSCSLTFIVHVQVKRNSR